jgi:diguanylate cyclase (GGDEF)-like protein
MIPAPIPENDAERVASLEGMTLLSTPREGDLDRITRTAQKVLGTDMALVSLVDADRQWFKSRFGLDTTETRRDISFCGHAILEDQTFIVESALEDERFHDNPLVAGDPKVRFYAGQPLTNDEGYRIGTLCVISSEPRTLDDDERQTLEDLGRMVEIVLDNRKLSETQAALLESLDSAKRESLIDPLSGLWNRRGLDELLDREIARAARERATLAVAIVDIDHFKRINDAFGHAKGDEAIKLTASILVESARSTDVVARYGGEEFAVVAPGVPPAMLPTLGNKLLRILRMKARLKTDAGPHPFTASIGMAVAAPRRNSAATAATLLDAADKALYEAKAGGRDRFEIADDLGRLYADFALA